MKTKLDRDEARKEIFKYQEMTQPHKISSLLAYVDELEEENRRLKEELGKRDFRGTA